MIQGDMVNAFDYMSEAEIEDVVSNTAAIDVQPAVQAAIDAATAAKKILRLPAGTYRIEAASLTISGNQWIVGDGKDGTKLQCRYAGACIVAAQWGGKLQGFSVFTYNVNSNGINITENSRNWSVEDLYLDATAVGSTNVGTGIYMYQSSAGFIGGGKISNTYALQFKFGALMDGANISTATVTSICMYDFWVVGGPGAARAGSRGIYMSARTDGVGTAMYGGTIESFEYGIYIDNGSKGGVFETDLEGNTNPFYIGNNMQGHITSAFGVPRVLRTCNSPTVNWEYSDLLSGQGPRQENYYAPSWLVSTGSATAQSINFYRNNVSVIDGGSLQVQATKFSFGLGSNGVDGIVADPNNHYLQVADRTIHWDHQSPAVTGGKAWVQGSICYNYAATVGQPTGWMCTVSGTPGTWVALANL